MAAVRLDRPEIIVSQFIDTRTYTRTLAMLANWKPLDLLVPVTPGHSDPATSGSKLYKEICEKFPSIHVQPLARKFFNDTFGMESVKRICIPQSSSVEAILFNKYYG